MSAINPYAPPGAVVDDLLVDGGERQAIRLFSPAGRIGRLRYLAYAVALGMAQAAVNGVASAVSAWMHGVMLTYAVFALVTIASLWLGSVWAVKRAHDMNWTGWSCLLMIIPFVAFVWLFKGGTAGANRFGAPPPPNPVGVKLLALLVPIFGIVMVGILAAIAIPAYHTYVQRAHAAQAGRV